MATYIILSRVSPEALEHPKAFRDLPKAVADKLERECPGVVWKSSYATMGRFDVVDIVESDDPREVRKASMIIRSIGRSRTETLPATPWDEFLATL